MPQGHHLSRLALWVREAKLRHPILPLCSHASRQLPPQYLQCRGDRWFANVLVTPLLETYGDWVVDSQSGDWWPRESSGQLIKFTHQVRQEYRMYWTLNVWGREWNWPWRLPSLLPIWPDPSPLDWKALSPKNICSRRQLEQSMPTTQVTHLKQIWQLRRFLICHLSAYIICSICLFAQGVWNLYCLALDRKSWPAVALHNHCYGVEEKQTKTNK